MNDDDDDDHDNLDNLSAINDNELKIQTLKTFAY